MTFESPTSGNRVGMSFLTPNSREDVERRSQMMLRWARFSGGMLGRSPDSLNCGLTAFANAAEYFARNDPNYAENIRNYYDYVRENDLCLTHTLINPQKNRAQSADGTPNPEVATRIVDETAEGLIVNGARILATLGPLSDEIMVFPSTVVKAAEGAEAYAFAFAIPCDTPGLKFICREVFDYGRSTADHPLGSRFEETDSIVIFDSVRVPWERVFLKGDAAMCSGLFAETNAVVHMMHQVACKNSAKAEFLVGVASAVVDALGSGKFPHVQEKVAECIRDLELIKACLRASEADAAVDQWGVMCPNRPPLDIARNVFQRCTPE